MANIIRYLQWLGSLRVDAESNMWYIFVIFYASLSLMTQLFFKMTALYVKYNAVIAEVKCLPENKLVLNSKTLKKKKKRAIV